jgi:chemotaxis protein CheX
MPTAQPFTDAELEDMVKEAVEKFFSTMISDAATFQEAFHCNEDTPPEKVPGALQSDKPIIASAVGFLGDINGVIYLYFEEPLAKRLTGQFLGMEMAEVEAEGHEVVNDALGEISNMIGGTFKNSMCDRGQNCRLTIPSILRGKNFAIESTSMVNRKVFRFETGGSIFSADLLMKLGDSE